MQILEEENIELMKENKELRKEASSLKAALSRVTTEPTSAKKAPSERLRGEPSPAHKAPTTGSQGSENDPSRLNSVSTTGKRSVANVVKPSQSEDEGTDKKRTRSQAKAVPLVDGEEQAGECKQS
jgi:hypothetical protein